MTATSSDPFGRIRAACLALPEVDERLSHGEATWFVGKRVFVTSADRHHHDRRAVWIAAAEGVQETMVDADPARFFRPPYVGGRGVYLDVPVHWDELEALFRDAYRLIAPRRLLNGLRPPGAFRPAVGPGPGAVRPPWAQGAERPATLGVQERSNRRLKALILGRRPRLVRQPSSSPRNAGSQNPNSAPFPSRWPAQIRPPMPSTSWRQTNNPMPAPDARRAASGAR